jgi:hypothetical protein
MFSTIQYFFRGCRRGEEERGEDDDEEEAVFIRGVNTNEDSPNAQHAPHRPVQDTGAMSA